MLVSNYKSLNALLKFLEKNEDTTTNQDSSHHEDDGKWSGTKNFEEALELLRSGSDEIKAGLKKNVKVAEDKIAKELNTQPQGYLPDVIGAFFDVAKVIEGEPEAWYKQPWDKEQKPRIKIPVMGSYNSTFEVEDAIKNASEIIALIKALENAGIEIELDMVFYAINCTYDNEAMKHTVVMKAYDESFNWNKLSAMLHPSFFRRVIFRDKELLSPDNLTSGYGRTGEPSDIFPEGSDMLSIQDSGSVARFRENILYKLGGK